jgi:hypothetical protein
LDETIVHDQVIVSLVDFQEDLHSVVDSLVDDEVVAEVLKVGNFLFYRCKDMQDFYKSMGKKKDNR